MKILIAGVGKTGTTAMFHKILAAMPPGTREVYERETYTPDASAHVLAKILLGMRIPTRVEQYVGFDKTVVMIRDPRDTLVSWMLYRYFAMAHLRQQPAAMAEIIGQLQAKERDPRSVSMRQIIDTGTRLLNDPRKPLRYPDHADVIAFLADRPGSFHMRYEALVAGDFGALAEYLGLPLTSALAVVPEQRQRVVRTRAAGGWRDWFTPDDVTCFRPLLREAMDAYGYTDDWELAEQPAIDPATCSRYVDMLFKERLPKKPQPPAPRPLWRRIGSRVKRLLVPRPTN